MKFSSIFHVVAFDLISNVSTKCFAEKYSKTNEVIIVE